MKTWQLNITVFADWLLFASQCYIKPINPSLEIGRDALSRLETSSKMFQATILTGPDVSVPRTLLERYILEI